MSELTTNDVTSVERDGLLAVALRPPAGPADPVEAWMVDAPAALIAEVREHAAAPDGRPGRIALVLHAPAAQGRDERVAAQALTHAVRGIAQSLALELAPDTRVNAVLCDDAASPEETLTLLGGPDGGFITGATIDLRRPE
jgi:NAD(P)-dependent dehydrogenase (short-subunit alcohol dehydrogenase family)